MIFAKNQRHHQPVVSGTHAAITAVKALKGGILVLRHVGSRPLVTALAHRERIGRVLGIEDVQPTTPFNLILRLADQYAVHLHFITGREISGRKFVLGRNVFGQRVAFSVQHQFLTLFQIRQRDDYVIGWVDF